MLLVDSNSERNKNLHDNPPAVRLWRSSYKILRETDSREIKRPEDTGVVLMRGEREL